MLCWLAGHRIWIPGGRLLHRLAHSPISTFFFFFAAPGQARALIFDCTYLIPRASPSWHDTHTPFGWNEMSSQQQTISISLRSYHHWIRIRKTGQGILISDRTLIFARAKTTPPLSFPRLQPARSTYTSIFLISVHLFLVHRICIVRGGSGKVRKGRIGRTLK